MNDTRYDEMIRASCGESLAGIWLKKSKVDFAIMGQLTGIALIEALSIIRHRRPDWYKEFKSRYPDKTFK